MSAMLHWMPWPWQKQLLSQSTFLSNIISSNSNHQGVIATKFCTWHDSYAVVSCAKICCNVIVKNGLIAKCYFPHILSVPVKSLVPCSQDISSAVFMAHSSVIFPARWLLNAPDDPRPKCHWYHHPRPICLSGNGVIRNCWLSSLKCWLYILKKCTRISWIVPLIFWWLPSAEKWMKHCICVERWDFCLILVS